MHRFIVISAVLVCLTGCGKNSADFSGLGLLKETIVVDNITREYLLYLPAHLEKDAPLVFVCHGYTGNAADMIKYTRMNDVAEKNGFAVCYPQGTKDRKGSAFWQVGYSFHKGNSVDDVRFLDILARNLQKKYGFNQKRTFLTGMSNGGDLCNRVAHLSTKTFAALAPVVGCLMKCMTDSFPDPHPIPILMINGTADDITLWNGDLEDRGGWGPYYSTPYMFDYWLRINKCNQVDRLILPDINMQDGSQVVLEKHSGGAGSEPVWIYTVMNGGHDWPGGSGNMDFQASEAIWNFFASDQIF